MAAPRLPSCKICEPQKVLSKQPQHGPRWHYGAVENQPHYNRINDRMQCHTEPMPYAVEGGQETRGRESAEKKCCAEAKRPKAQFVAVENRNSGKEQKENSNDQ